MPIEPETEQLLKLRSGNNESIQTKVDNVQSNFEPETLQLLGLNKPQPPKTIPERMTEIEGRLSELSATLDKKPNLNIESEVNAYNEKVKEFNTTLGNYEKLGRQYDNWVGSVNSTLGRLPDTQKVKYADPVENKVGETLLQFTDGLANGMTMGIYGYGFEKATGKRLPQAEGTTQKISSKVGNVVGTLVPITVGAKIINASIRGLARVLPKGLGMGIAIGSRILFTEEAARHAMLNSYEFGKALAMGDEDAAIDAAGDALLDLVFTGLMAKGWYDDAKRFIPAYQDWKTWRSRTPPKQLEPGNPPFFERAEQEWKFRDLDNDAYAQEAAYQEAQRAARAKNITPQEEATGRQDLTDRLPPQDVQQAELDALRATTLRDVAANNIDASRKKAQYVPSPELMAKFDTTVRNEEASQQVKEVKRSIAFNERKPITPREARPPEFGIMPSEPVTRTLADRIEEDLATELGEELDLTEADDASVQMFLDRFERGDTGKLGDTEVSTMASADLEQVGTRELEPETAELIKKINELKSRKVTVDDVSKELEIFTTNFKQTKAAKYVKDITLGGGLKKKGYTSHDVDLVYHINEDVTDLLKVAEKIDAEAYDLQQPLLDAVKSKGIKEKFYGTIDNIFEQKGKYYRLAEDGSLQRLDSKVEEADTAPIEPEEIESISDESDSIFREDPETALSRKKLYEGNKSVAEDLDELFAQDPIKPTKDPGTTMWSLINRYNLWLNGEGGIGGVAISDQLSEFAARADEFKAYFPDKAEFEGWKELLSDAADWARNTKKIVSVRETSKKLNDADKLLNQIRPPEKPDPDIMASEVPGKVRKKKREFKLEKTNILPSLLKDITNQNPARTMMYELLQNSLDAMLSPGEITIELTQTPDYDGTFLDFTDTGKGMSPEEVEAFLLVGGSEGKSGMETRGGYGQAKIALFLIPEEVHVITTNNGITSEINLNREKVLTGMVDVKDYNTPDEPNGTKFTAKIPRIVSGREVGSYELGSAAKELLKSVWSDSHIVLKSPYWSKDLAPGTLADVKKFRPSESYHLNGSDVGIHFVEVEPYGWNDGGKYQVDAKVTNKGLIVDIPMADIIDSKISTRPDFKVVIDFEHTPKIKDDRYPFLKNRTELVKEHIETVKGIVKPIINDIGRATLHAKGDRFRNMVKTSPEFEGVKLLLPYEGESLVKAKELISGHEELIRAFSKITKEFVRILQSVGETDLEYHLTVDPKVYGYHASEDYTGDKAITALNPFSLTKYNATTVGFSEAVARGESVPRLQGDAMTHTMLHENVHRKEYHHRETFTIELARQTVAIGHKRLHQLAVKMEKFYEQYGDEVEQLGQDFDSLRDSGTGLREYIETLPVQKSFKARERDIRGVTKKGKGKKAGQRQKGGGTGFEIAGGRGFTLYSGLPIGAGKDIVLGWYSALRRIARERLPKTTYGQQIINIFTGTDKKGNKLYKNITRDEWESIKLEDIIDPRRKYSRDEILKIIDEGTTELQDVWLRKPEYIGATKTSTGERYSITNPFLDETQRDIVDPTDYWGIPREQAEALRARNSNRSGREPQYPQYQMPGGENYAELFVTAPDITGGREMENLVGEMRQLREEMLRTPIPDRGGPRFLAVQDRVIFLEDEIYFQSLAIEQRLRDGLTLTTDNEGRWNIYDSRVMLWTYPEGFESRGECLRAAALNPDLTYAESRRWRDGHPNYSFVTNPIVRIRMNDRKIVIDGREEKVLFIEELQAPLPAEQAKMPELYKKRWREIGMKRVFMHAVNGGYDRVAWTSGKMQNERWSKPIRQNLESVSWEKMSDSGRSIDQLSQELGRIRHQLDMAQQNANELYVEYQDGLDRGIDNPDLADDLFSAEAMVESLRSNYNEVDQELSFKRRKGEYQGAVRLVGKARPNKGSGFTKTISIDELEANIGTYAARVIKEGGRTGIIASEDIRLDLEKLYDDDIPNVAKKLGAKIEQMDLNVSETNSRKDHLERVMVNLAGRIENTNTRLTYIEARMEQVPIGGTAYRSLNRTADSLLARLESLDEQMSIVQEELDRLPKGGTSPVLSTPLNPVVDKTRGQGFTVFSGIDPFEVYRRIAKAIKRPDKRVQVKDLNKLPAEYRGPLKKAIEYRDAFETDERASELAKHISFKQARQLGEEAIWDTLAMARKMLLEAQKVGSDTYRLTNNALNRLINQAGGHAYGQILFNQMLKEVYGGFKKNEVSAINKLIRARRIKDIALYKPKSVFPESQDLDNSVLYDSFLEIIEDIPKARADKIRAAVEKYFEWERKVVTDMEKEGIYSKELADGLRNHDYSKFRGIGQRIKLQGQGEIPIDVLFDNREKITLGGRTISVNDSGIESLQHGRRTDILETDQRLVALEIFNRGYGRKFRNRVMSTFAELAKAVPSNPIAKLPKKDANPDQPGLIDARLWSKFNYFKDGKRHTVYLDTKFANSLMVAGADVSPRMIQWSKWKAMAPPAKTMMTGAAPLWSLFVNLPIDVLNSYLTAGTYEEGKFKHVYSDWLPIFAGQKLRDFGSTFYDTFFRAFKTLDRTKYMRASERGLLMPFLATQARTSMTGYKLPGRFAPLENFFQYFPESLELWTRLAAVERTIRRRAKEKNISVEEARQDDEIMDEAVFVGRDKLDFSQGGWWIRAMDQQGKIYLNAGTQAVRTFLRSMNEGNWHTWIRLVQAIGIPTILATVLGILYSRKTYDSQPSYLGKNNITIPFPDNFIFEDKTGQEYGFVLTLPVGSGVAFFKNLFTAATEKAMYELGFTEKEPNYKVIVESLIQTAPDMTSMEPSERAVFEYLTNIDTWTMKNITPETFPWPMSEGEYTPWQTPQLAQDVGKVTKLSPDRLEKVKEALLGNNIWSALVGKGYEEIMGNVPKELQEEHLALVLSEIPGIKRFIKTVKIGTGRMEEQNPILDQVRYEDYINTRDLDVYAKAYYWYGAKEGRTEMNKLLQDTSRVKTYDEKERLINRAMFIEKVKGLPERSAWLKMWHKPAEAKAREYYKLMQEAGSKEARDRLREQFSTILDIDEGYVGPAFYEAYERISNENR